MTDKVYTLCVCRVNVNARSRRASIFTLLNTSRRFFYRTDDKI